jgi:hypothetical protein
VHNDRLPLISSLAVAMGLLILAIDVLVLVSFFSVFLEIRDHRRRGGLPYPPGPRPLPLIGNLLDIPKEFSWLTYSQHSRIHGKNYSVVRILLTEGMAGDIISFHIFGQVIVVLNSIKATKGLLERRGEIYSDRPIVTIHEMYVVQSFTFSHGI